ncbi:hypothetical protein Bca4012_060355 [Brassica carinata]
MTDDRSVSNAYNVSDVSLNPNMPEVAQFVTMLPKDVLPLAIVQSKPLSIGSRVSEKEDFFVHTPRKTIAEVLESRQQLGELGADEIYSYQTTRIEFCLVNIDLTHIKCVAYGKEAVTLNNYYQNSRANVDLCVLRSWSIEWGEGRGFPITLRNHKLCLHP